MDAKQALIIANAIESLIIAHDFHNRKYNYTPKESKQRIDEIKTALIERLKEV